jgi:hypothetical protein
MITKYLQITLATYMLLSPILFFSSAATESIRYGHTYFYYLNIGLGLIALFFDIKIWLEYIKQNEAL